MEPTPEQEVALAMTIGEAGHMFDRDFAAEDFVQSTEMYCRLLAWLTTEIKAGVETRHMAVALLTAAMEVVATVVDVVPEGPVN